MAPNFRDRSIVIIEQGVIAIAAFNAFNKTIDSIANLWYFTNYKLSPYREIAKKRLQTDYNCIFFYNEDLTLTLTQTSKSFLHIWVWDSKHTFSSLLNTFRDEFTGSIMYLVRLTARPRQRLQCNRACTFYIQLVSRSSPTLTCSSALEIAVKSSHVDRDFQILVRLN